MRLPSHGATEPPRIGGPYNAAVRDMLKGSLAELPPHELAIFSPEASFLASPTWLKRRSLGR